MTRFLLTLIFFTCIKLCYSFPPNEESVPGSKSHEYITRFGIYGAVAKYLKLNKNVGDIFSKDYEFIKEYFSSDTEGLKRFKSAIHVIEKSNNDIQKDKAEEAKISFNGEQIMEGHYRLVHLRDLIQHEATADFPIVDNIRELIGQYLYTLQSFYSNTNWIEMRGAIVYFDLGIKGAEIMDIASPSENTCNNSNSGQKHFGNCPNNIIELNKLTSGYKSGQDLKKPESSHNDEGKCSHGGPEDTTTSTTANCGINKETSNPELSPHNHLHEAAADAALRATEYFIFGNATGLISLFTDRLFEEVFGLNNRSTKSLSYAIDVSGSMSNDIQNVKTVTEKMIKNLLYGPADYVLATFNDPETLTTGYVTNEASHMIDKIGSLTVSGGDDCPEYVFSGIAKAISLSRYKSELFVFTDASAKDEDQVNKVLQLAINKKIKISFLLTGKCSKRKRRSKELQMDDMIRHKRQSSFGSVFDILAKATGGSVHSISSTELPNVLETLLKDSFPNISIACNQVYIDYIRRSENNSLLQFYVDNGLTELQIEFTGVQTVSDFNVTDPNGDLVIYSSNNNTWRTISFDKIDVIISMPLPGQWSIVPSVNSIVSANISGQGFTDFTFKIMKEHTDGFLYEVPGNPIAGETYRFIIQLSGDVKKATLLSLNLIDLDGVGISMYPLEVSSRSNDRRYTADIIMPPMKFICKVSGKDGDGNIFTRIKWLIIYPVQVQLTLITLDDELLINEDYELQYKMTNLGDTSESFLATITDNQGFSVPPTERNHTVAAGNSTQDMFIFHPTANSSRSMVYTIEIRQSESNQIMQAISKNVYVTSVQHPTCKVVYVDGSCPLGEVTPSNCTQYKWLAMTETTYSSIALSSVTLSNIDSNTQLMTGNTSSVFGPLATNVSGTCCLDIVDLYIMDTDGYLATCRLNFRYKRPESTVVNDVNDVKNETTEADSSDNSKIVVIAVGVSVAVLIVIFIILLIVNYCGSFFKVKHHADLHSTPNVTGRVSLVDLNQSVLNQTDWQHEPSTQDE